MSIRKVNGLNFLLNGRQTEKLYSFCCKGIKDRFRKKSSMKDHFKSINAYNRTKLLKKKKMLDAN